MKKKSGSSSSSPRGTSPTKVAEFSVFGPHKKKNVRFKSPLEEYQDATVTNTSMMGTRGQSTLLDTPTEVLDPVEYFCKCDTFINAFQHHTF
mmetsp:Transcript_27156/g.58166  ORF Transcript_27156/g.58166 Transcript_27156/m.58166 type:complete len:92 (-) Transcript_27156:28-303(-)